ncbi:MAG: FHA domain-containing protein, partial [Bdellovibrionota bacterium]
MRENDSFLKMIGLEDESTSPSEALPASSVEAEASEEVYSEAAHSEAAYSEEVYLEEAPEEEVPSEGAFSEEGSTEEVCAEEGYTEEIYAEEFLTAEALTAEVLTAELPAEEAKEEEIDAEENHTNNLDSTERIEISKEDRLLQGIEEAEASRATDIYARSFRQDHRETRAFGLQDESDPFDDFDQTHEQDSPLTSAEEVPELESLSGEIMNDQIESEDSRSTQAFRRTQEFQYEESSGPILFAVSGYDLQKEISLSNLPLTIGRDPQNQLVIDDSSISRFHAEIRLLGDEIQILDLGSTNGIKLNGALIQAQTLKNRDVIHVGDIIFEFLSSKDEIKDSPEVQAVRETIVSKTAAMANSRKKLFKTKRSKLIAASVLILFAVALGLNLLKSFSTNIKNTGAEFIATQTENAVESFKAKIQDELGRGVEELTDDELRQRFQAEMDSISLPLPETFMKGLRGLPMPVVRFFLRKPEVLKDYLKDTSSTFVIEAALKAEIQGLLAQQNFSEAESLLGQLLKLNPEDLEAQSLQAELEKQKNPIEAPAPLEISEEEQELFYNYMKTYQEKTEELLAAKKYEIAVQFIDDIKAAIIELSRSGPQYGDLVGSALSEWSSKQEVIKKTLIVKEQKEKEMNEVVLMGRQKLEEAQAQLNLGRVSEAQGLLA